MARPASFFVMASRRRFAARFAVLLVAAAALLATAPAMAAEAAVPGTSPGALPVVVELFTSQGCNSCPPADALLTDLANRPGVLALGFHVDYWDYLGWKDSLALHEATTRQQAYGAALGGRYVYTPEMVIDGARTELGSDRTAVIEAIGQATTGTKLRLSADRDATGGLTVRLPAATRATTATLWLVRYMPQETVRIGGGENGGKTLIYSNVVHAITRLAGWSGDASAIPIAAAALKGPGRHAVLLQAGSGGPILGALRLPPAAEPGN